MGERRVQSPVDPQLSARCLRAVPPGGDEQGAADRWEGMWGVLELVAEDPGGDAAERLQLAASRFMLRHVDALVEQARFVDNRAEIAEQLRLCCPTSAAGAARRRAPTVPFTISAAAAGRGCSCGADVTLMTAQM